MLMITESLYAMVSAGMKSQVMSRVELPFNRNGDAGALASAKDIPVDKLIDCTRRSSSPVFLSCMTLRFTVLMRLIFQSRFEMEAPSENASVRMVPVVNVQVLPNRTKPFC